MADAHIKAVITAEDRASATLRNFGNKASSLGSTLKKGLKIAAVGLAAAGAGAIAFGVSSVKAFQESQKATAQLNAVLKSTKGAAGVSAKAATDLANKLSLLNAVDDEAVMGAENMLLTFTNIGKNIFPQTTQAAIDMATAMNGGAIPSADQLRNTTIQLGKALQSPDAGLGALKRVGVNVDELRKKFTESMSVQEKQKLILKELATEFGGSGTEAAKTFGGQLNLLKIQFDNVKESIGKAIVDGLTPLMTKLSEFVASDQFQAWLSKLTTWLQVNLPIAINYVVETLIPNLVNIFNTVWPVLRTVIAWFGKFINFLADHEAAVWVFIGVIAAMKAMLVITSVVKNFKAGLAAMRTAYAITSGVLSTPILITIAIAAALAAMALVRKKAMETMDTLDQLDRANANKLSSQSDARERLIRLQKYGTPAQKKRAASQLKKGTAAGTFATGGFTGRGAVNDVAGIVHKGEYVLPKPMVNQNTGQPKMMGGVTNINISINAGAYMGSQQDARKHAKIIYNALIEMAGMKGMTLQQLVEVGR